MTNPAIAPEPEETVIAYKGFDKYFRCRGFQFEIGKTYKHDGKAVACESGFHACEHPLHVLRYYRASAGSRYARVTQSGALARHSDDDTKIASAHITINAEIDLPDLVAAAVQWVFDRATWNKKAMAAKDNEGAAASGRSGAATASGDYGAATASGGSGAATASGFYGAATASGGSGAATASGRSGRAKGDIGCALFLVERDDAWKIIAAWAGIVGRDDIKPGVFYSLRNGKPVEA